MAAGIFIAGFGSILTGLNFIVTIHKMRAPGLTWFRLPLFIWSLYATSLILVLATPVLAITLALMALERVWGVGIFDPKLGGDPLLFQHLFWFYSHPAVYIMILAGHGRGQRIDPLFLAQTDFRLPFRRLCQRGDRHARLSGLGTSHVCQQPIDLCRNDFFASELSGRHSVGHQSLQLDGDAVQRVDLISNADALCAWVYRAVHRRRADRACSSRRSRSMCMCTDTYFVIAHFHYIMVGGMVTAFMGGLHYWWPKITGRMYPENWGKLAALTTFIGFNLTFFPQFVLGYLGMPRRYHAYPPEFQIFNVLSTAGASILGVGYLLAAHLFYLVAQVRERIAGPNPWNATGLEWQTTSPPPKHNFEETPIVTGQAVRLFSRSGA